MLIVGDDEHEHWWVLTAPGLVVSGGGDNNLITIWCWFDIDMQFETATPAGQAEYFEQHPYLDFARNQGYKFGRTSSKSDLKSDPNLPKFAYCVLPY